jgi:hypothetical protein
MTKVVPFAIRIWKSDIFPRGSRVHFEPRGFVFLHGDHQFVAFVLRHFLQKAFGPISRNTEGQGPSILRDNGNAAPRFVRRMLFYFEYRYRSIHVSCRI